MSLLLILLAVGFAFSMGAHYTGACMGMPRALSAISATGALVVMAPLALIGATFASHGVEHTVAHELLRGPGLSTPGLVIVIGVAFGLTSGFNFLRIPTSTIQILVFCVVGTGLAAGLRVGWTTIIDLAVIWVSAPLVAAAVGFALTRLLDLVPGVRMEAAREQRSAVDEPPDVVGGERRLARGPGWWLGSALVAVGALASFTMGANDVANATGSLVAAHTFSPLVAGLVGGAGLALGVLTWGRPLLNKVAFDIVTVDRPMAAAAQLVQAGVVLAAVGFGFFTSMNQALVGAMTGAAAARGRRTVNRRTLLSILRGWIVGPGAGAALSFSLSRLVMLAAGSDALRALH